MVKAAFIAEVIKFGYSRFLICLVPVIFAIYILSYLPNFYRSKELMTVSAKNSHIDTLSALTDQAAPQERNISSNQSEDIKAMRNSMSEQVQLLRNMTLGFAKISTQASFAALGVFLLGMALVVFGLRLTVRATAKETSIYFKIMMWGLITPVIAIIAIYQIGILTGSRILEFVKMNEPFFFISLLLWIPAGIVLFLLIAEQRILPGHHKKQQ